MNSQRREGGLQMQAAEQVPLPGAICLQTQAHLPGCHTEKTFRFLHAPAGCLQLQLPEILPAAQPCFPGC